MTAHKKPDELPFSLERPSSQAEAIQFCDGFSTAMEHLLEIIERETELVRAGQLKEAGSLQAQKSKLIHEYTRGMMCTKENAVALGNLAPAAVQALKRQHAEFQPVLRINLAVLSTAREVANDIVSSVAKAAGAQKKSTTYGADGSRPEGPGAVSGIAINQSL